jgi:hypothetical protein
MTQTQPTPADSLSGYLVIWRHTMDDVPLGLFGSADAALQFAMTVTFDAAYATARKLEIDCTTPVCFAVVTFENGLPTEIESVDRPDDDDGLRRPDWKAARNGDDLISNPPGTEE